MFGLFGKKAIYKETALQLYGALNIQSRKMVFYTRCGVPDTTEGRFDVICLHSFLIMSRLQREGKEGDYVSQALFDVIFRQFERALREMGVGDLSVPRHVKRMMTAYKGRYYAYEGALKNKDNTMLAEVIKRNVFGHDDAVGNLILNELADYMRTNHEYINQMCYETFIEGQNLFTYDFFEGEAKDDKKNRTRMAA